MRSLIVKSVGTALALAILLAGCSKLGLDKLGLGGRPAQSKELPSPRQLKRIAYMSQSKGGPNGRPIYDHLEQAKSCHDLGIAMRWNRPPDIKGGPFNERMTYISAGVPAGLSKESEVFLTGKIKAGQSMPSGGSVWALTLPDGSEIQAIESPEYTEKQEEAQQQPGAPQSTSHPYTPGRLLCVYGVYQGDIGMALGKPQHVPLVSVLFAMDRSK
ncbi:MAG TPA: hypothetical protein VMA54_05835 [Steroidobacteraceae bacterium]|nr:hypothetical protein [Steroidobacteraceae bacterium]